ncbi:MAG: hypothetical protein DRG58_04230 [Deltaproteobacteria bacterium]|nr:MAG: hypothetical protein DRG58_04230 [Deltaproteobacteria bacterium]
MVQFSYLWLGWLLLLIPLVALLQWRYRRWQKSALKNFAGPQLGDALLENTRLTLKRRKQRLLLLSLILIGIALVGPKIGRKLREVKRRGVDIVIAFDTSISMRAEDVKPNRLDRAKYEAGKFLNLLRGDRVGLVAFAGISYLHCPLTLDYSAAKLFLDVIDTGIIGTQGTAIADALETALKAFNSQEKKHKAIIIISDGEDHEGDLEAALARVQEAGAVIYAVGVGSLTGAPIPVVDEKTGTFEFKRDRAGRVVTTALKESTLRQIASTTGGRYYRLGVDADVFGKIYNEIASMEKKDIRSHEYSDYQERFQPFLLAGILLLIISMMLPEKVHPGKTEKEEG